MITLIQNSRQLFNLTDRQAEASVRDNAAFQVFCGRGLIDPWHVPDHTAIESFRSRLLPETQRALANHLAVQARTLKYANPATLDIDSTVQEANIAWPATANLLVKVAGLAKRFVPFFKQCKDTLQRPYSINFKKLKALAFRHFLSKRAGETVYSLTWLKTLWREVFSAVYPVLKDSYQLLKPLACSRYGRLRRAMQQLEWQGQRLLSRVYHELFEETRVGQPIYSLHAREIACFNKNKLNRKKYYGRAYQLGRINGNFMMVGACTSLHMPDAKSLPALVKDHEDLFGKGTLQSLATDKGYYAHSNQRLLETKGIPEIGLARPAHYQNISQKQSCPEVDKKLHCRRAGIEPLIGHLKRSWQMGRSRMKSDMTTLSAGYASVLGFNLRQLKRYVTGEVYPKSQNLPKVADSTAVLTQ